MSIDNQMRNAIILAGKRTGSTFLQEALNSHPDVTCGDELFMNFRKNKKRRGQFLYGYMKTEGYSPEQYIKGLFSHEGAICFRLMYPHLEKTKQVEQVILQNKIPIIHLIRKNKLSHIVSSKTKKERKVRIDTNTLQSEIKKHEGRNKKYRSLFKNKVDYMEIYYEDMFGRVEGKKGDTKKYGAFNVKSEQITYLADKYTEKICNFLGVEHKELFCNVTKKNSGNIGKHVKNKKGVESCLKNTQGESFIEE